MEDKIAYTARNVGGVIFDVEVMCLQVNRVKSKELEDLKRSFKESMDELGTLRTKVCYSNMQLNSQVHTRRHHFK